VTVRERERRAQQRRQSDPIRDRELELSQFRVLTFAEWCSLNGFSPATGRRILNSGTGPVIIQLSDRRIGITVGANADWQASRARTPSAE
jgi:hypothetical protein